MHVLPLHTPLIRAGDNLASILTACGDIHSTDILVVSSKVIATAEDAAINLHTVTPTNDAEHYAKMTGRSAAFCQSVMKEAQRMHGTIRGAVHGVLLTELHPDGMEGSLLVPNAGLDQSNIDEGYAIGWPHDPVRSARQLSEALQIPVIISDSCVVARRRGVIAFALAACGMDPIRSEKGKDDLFHHPLLITEEAVADQLAIAANMVMGNAAQQCPAAIIREYDHERTDFCGWVPGIAAEEDLFGSML